MPIVFCPNCFKKISAPEAGIGKRGQCPSCKAWMRIPERDESPPVVKRDDADLRELAREPLPTQPTAPNRSVEDRAGAGFPHATPLLISILVYVCLAMLTGYAYWHHEVNAISLFSSAIAVAMIVTIVFAAIFVYRAWALLPAEQRISPAKAVGLMFVPIFNFYWVFIAVRELSERTVAEEHKRGQAQTSVVGIATALAVLFVLSQVLLPLPLLPAYALMAFMGVLPLWAVQQEKASAQAVGATVTAKKPLLIASLACTLAWFLLPFVLSHLPGASYSDDRSEDDPVPQTDYRPLPYSRTLQRSTSPNRIPIAGEPTQPQNSFAPAQNNPRPQMPPLGAPQRRTCTACNGSGTSDSQCQLCNGTGRTSSGFKCSHCGGRGFSNCPSCGGKGFTTAY